MNSQLNLRRFVFAAMLTPDDGSTDGAFTRYPCGSRDPLLHAFLQNCLASGRRDVCTLATHLAARCFDWSYDPVLAPILRSETDVDAYFATVAERPLDDALVLLDPDNGLMTLGSRREALQVRRLRRHRSTL